MAVLAVLAAALTVVSGLQSPTYLQVERIVNPVAISTTTPRLSWRVDLTDNFTRETSQIAYQVQVLDLITGTVAWDSAKTVFLMTLQAQMPMPCLQSSTDHIATFVASIA